jgi:hypothetical protein
VVAFIALSRLHVFGAYNLPAPLSLPALGANAAQSKSTACVRATLVPVTRGESVEVRPYHTCMRLDRNGNKWNREELLPAWVNGKFPP